MSHIEYVIYLWEYVVSEKGVAWAFFIFFSLAFIFCTAFYNLAEMLWITIKGEKVKGEILYYPQTNNFLSRFLNFNSKSYKPIVRYQTLNKTTHEKQVTDLWINLHGYMYLKENKYIHYPLYHSGTKPCMPIGTKIDLKVTNKKIVATGKLLICFSIIPALIFLTGLSLGLLPDYFNKVHNLDISNYDPIKWSLTAILCLFFIMLLLIVLDVLKIRSYYMQYVTK